MSTCSEINFVNLLHGLLILTCIEWISLDSSHRRFRNYLTSM